MCWRWPVIFCSTIFSFVENCLTFIFSTIVFFASKIMENWRFYFGFPIVQNRAQCVYYEQSSENVTFPVRIDGTVYYSDPRKVQWTYRDMYTILSRRYLISEEVLRKSGYPFFKNFGDLEKVTIRKTEFEEIEPIWIENGARMRFCCRCKNDFVFEENGDDICLFHSRNAKFDQESGQNIHECCGKISGRSLGCQLSNVHVFNQLQVSELENFVSTPKSLGPLDPRNRNVFGMDCEMVYTKNGPAIARLSLVDLAENVVLDIFVKPEAEILDPNTEFSGLTLQMIEEKATDNLETCRQKLFQFINSKSILIGHSLESDLKALRISHLTVIDTAIIFGGKLKPSLRKLARKYLRKSIQQYNSQNLGHDSIEDARTCVQLVKLYPFFSNQI